MKIINYGTRWRNGEIGKFEESNLELKWIELSFREGVLKYRYPIAERYHNAPVVAKGFIVYLLKAIEANPNIKSVDLFDSYFRFRLDQYKKFEELKPDAFSRDIASEFYDRHVDEEKKYVVYAKEFFKYLEADDVTLIKSYCDNYFTYIKKYGVNSQDIPKCFQTEKAKKILQKAVESGFILLTDKQYRWNRNKYTGQLLAYFCEKFSLYLELSRKVYKDDIKSVSWRPFEILFNENNIKSYKNDYMKTQFKFTPPNYELIDNLFNSTIDAKIRKQGEK